MIAKTREELEEIMPEGDLTLKQFNIRISNASIKQFNYILGILQLSSIGKVSKQNAIEYIIKKQFDSIMESPKNKGVSIADKVANGEKL